MNLIEQIKKQLQTRKRCKQLVKDKMYDQIYIEYGYDIYYKYVPRKIRRQDAKQLLKKGEWLELYSKHRDYYNSYLPKMREIDVITETGSKQKGIRERMKYNVKKELIPIMLSLAMTPPFIIGSERIIYDIEKKKNERIQEDGLDEYNKFIQQYAEEINSMNLTDIQIFVKLFRDIKRDLVEYESPEKGKEYFGNERLYFYFNKKGVCRNLANHLTAVLNEINPNYNARDIYTHLAPDDEFLVKRYFSEVNHRVTAVDIDGYTLFLDPTWETISVFYEGGIKHLSTIPGNAYINYKGMYNQPKFIDSYKKDLIEEDMILQIAKGYSFMSDNDISRIEAKYGQKAICQALCDIIELEGKEDKPKSTTEEYEK